MATHDHTVRIRRSVPADGALAGPPDHAFPARAAWPDHLRRDARADIALAVLALTRLRVDSERFRKAQALGVPGKPPLWPLSMAEMTSLGTAIHCLQQYVSLLGHEPQANPPDVP